MRSSLRALLVACIAVPSTAHAQSVAEIMAGVRSGGSWVEVPITNGRGSMKTMAIPTGGLTLAGCLNVWPGHSGTWEIRAHESVADEVLEIDLLPGIGVRFAHTFGMLAQIDFDFRWSELRDTTLMLWIGLELGSEASEEACEPTQPGSQM